MLQISGPRSDLFLDPRVGEEVGYEGENALEMIHSRSISLTANKRLRDTENTHTFGAGLSELGDQSPIRRRLPQTFYFSHKLFDFPLGSIVFRAVQLVNEPEALAPVDIHLEGAARRRKPLTGGESGASRCSVLTLQVLVFQRLTETTAELMRQNLLLGLQSASDLWHNAPRWQRLLAQQRRCDLQPCGQHKISVQLKVWFLPLMEWLSLLIFS